MSVPDDAKKRAEDQIAEDHRLGQLILAETKRKADEAAAKAAKKKKKS